MVGIREVLEFVVASKVVKRAVARGRGSVKISPSAHRSKRQLIWRSSA